MNLAAIISSPKAPPSVQSLPIPTPAPNELLIKVSAMGFNAIEAKIAKLAAILAAYPAILGSSYTDAVEALGSTIKIIASALVRVEKMVIRIPERSDEAVLASLVMNASCIPGLLSGRLGSRRPSDEISTVRAEGNKIFLVYGGSSRFGRLCVRCLRSAGYAVTATSSPWDMEYARELGVDIIVDHAMPWEHVVRELEARGPYEVIVETISTPQTIHTMRQVLNAQGGGKPYSTQTSFGPEDLPHGVERVFEAWSEPLYEQDNKGLLEWVVEEYLPFGMHRGCIIAQPVARVNGGLKDIPQDVGNPDIKQ